MLQPLVDNIKDAWPREKKNMYQMLVHSSIILYFHTFIGSITWKRMHRVSPQDDNTQSSNNKITRYKPVRNVCWICQGSLNTNDKSPFNLTMKLGHKISSEGLCIDVNCQVNSWGFKGCKNSIWQWRSYATSALNEWLYTQ